MPVVIVLRPLTRLRSRGFEPKLHSYAPNRSKRRTRRGECRGRTRRRLDGVCAACSRSPFNFQRVYAALDGRVAFLGLDLLSIQGETKPAATALARKTGVRYPLGYDEGGIIYGHFAPRLLMPVTLLIRSNGILAHRQFGPLDAARLRELIRIHLGVER